MHVVSVLPLLVLEFLFHDRFNAAVSCIYNKETETKFPEFLCLLKENSGYQEFVTYVASKS